MTCEMDVTYEFQTRVTCPVDGERILLAVSVRSDEMIPVEDLLRSVADITASPVMQEPFTEILAHRWGVRVSTVGVHSGVKITCSV